MATGDPSDAFVTTMADSAATTPTDTSGGVAPAVGAVLGGRYTIRRLLGAGGMGVVLEADDRVLGEPVALKLLRGAASPTALERFKREILLARKVTHPNVCRLFELSLDDPPFLSMELVRGESLAERLRRGRMTPAEALPIVEQMVAALEAAHAAGVVHRDFKSGNVLLERGDRAVVTDFGVARTTEGDAQLTGDAVVGTPAYMAPEQVAGEAVGPAADVYSLGVVIFEMLRGELPFAAEAPLVAAAQRLTRPAPPLAIDARWDAAVAACLARRPEDRPLPAQVLAILRGHPPRRRWPWIVAPIAIAGVATAFALTRGAHPPGVAVIALDAGPKVAAPPSGTPLEQAKAYELRGELTAARKVVEDALARTPDDGALRLMRVRLLHQQTRDDDAQAELARIDDASLTETDRAVAAAYHDDASSPSRAADELVAVFRSGGGADIGLEATMALLHVSRVSDAETLIEELAKRPELPADLPLASYLSGVAMFNRTDYGAATTTLRQVAAEAEQAGYSVLSARALGYAAASEGNAGEFGGARADEARAESTLRDADEEDALADLMGYRGVDEFFLGAYDRAEVTMRAALAVEHAWGGDRTDDGVLASAAGDLALQGRFAESNQQLADLAARMPNSSMVPYFAAWTHLLTGEIHDAQREITHLIGEIGVEASRFRCFANWIGARVSLAGGDPAGARARADEGLRLAIAGHFRPLVSFLRITLAEIDLHDGKVGDAIALARDVEADADQMGLRDPQIRARRILSHALADPVAAALARAEAAALCVGFEDASLTDLVQIDVAVAGRDQAALADLAQRADAAGLAGTAVTAQAAAADLAHDARARAAAEARAQALGLALPDHIDGEP